MYANQGKREKEKEKEKENKKMRKERERERGVASHLALAQKAMIFFVLFVLTLIMPTFKATRILLLCLCWKVQFLLISHFPFPFWI